eukprot:CAMPEP_0171987622 /NCGR_PEP_ID=MMETSP0993-20121228/275481_1 /TAXON_ID=483369 /ORGANISM="non described non described, Strain CCMP2098" /LENGTH=965 /DNA_ID=CAMNT_0012640567 /DNA_START=302 /DNA_END=3199 /DNA_ORIENTATION=+
MFQPKLQLTAHEEAELVPTAAWVQAAIPRCCARCALRLSGATRPDLYACTTAALVAATGLLAAEPVDPPRRHDGYSCCPVCLGFLGCLDDDRGGHENSGGGCGVTPAAVGGPEATAVTAAAASSSPPAEIAAAAAASSASIGLRAELLRSKALAGHQDVSGFRLHLQVPPELELRDQAAKCFLQKRAAATTTTTVAAAAAASAAAGALAPPIDTETSAAATTTETAVAEAAGTTEATTETAATASCQEIGGTTLLQSSSSSSPPPPQVAQTTNVWLRSFAAPGGGGHGLGWCVELKDALKWRLSARLSSCALEGLPRLLNTSYDGREASSSSSGQSATPEDVAGVDLLLAPTKHAVALPRALPTTETETVAEGSKKSPVPLSPASDPGLALANLLGFDCSSSSSSNDSFGDGDYGYGASGGGGKGKGKRKQWWNKQSNNKSSSGSSNGGGGGGGDAASTPVSTALLALPEAAEMLKQCVALVRGAGGGRESLAAWFESLLSPPKPQPQLQLQPQPLWSCTWSRAPLLIGGRYRKLKRDVPQSKWIIQGEGRKGRGSVEECLALHVAAAFGVKPCAPNTCDMAEDGLSYLKPNSKQQPQELQQQPQQPQPQKQDESSSPPLLSGGVKFHAAGREDMDVLMLGRGRPFILEVIDAKTLHPLKPRLILKQQEPLSLSPPTPPPHLGLELYGSLPSIQARINNVDSVDTDNTSGMAAAAGEATSSGCRHGLDVECEALQHVRRSVYDEIIAGAEEKKKTYGCVVWASSPLVDQELLKQAFAGVCDLEINQDTPIRVLHRRTPMVRKKTIHALTPTFIKPHWFELEVEASAGTYIKEFVHGDLGRTSPSVGDLLREALAKKLVALQRQKIIGLQLDELENGTGTQPEESGHGEQTLPPHKKPKREGAAAAPLEDDGDASDAAAADAAVRVAVAGAAATEEQEEEGEEARSLRVDILQLDVKAVHTTGLLA